MPARKPDESRRFISFVFVIVLGLIIGIFLRSVRVGLIIGLALGLLGGSLIRRR